MAPVRSKRNSSEIKSPMHTPSKGGVKKIRQGQKLALIDNLQLEVTERARKLRAQYALQAHTLRSRVELRVNRIPLSLRKANIGELFEKNAAPLQSEGKAIAKKSSKATAPQVATESLKPCAAASPGPKRGVKRSSELMSGADKENTPDPSQGLQNPKKRSKAEASAARPAPNASTVLSPKSSNSRMPPQASTRPPFASQKSANSRPASPLKPASPVKAATAAATSMLANMVNEKSKNTRANTTATRKAAKPAAEAKRVASRTKRGADQQVDRVVSSSSNASGTSAFSAGTTIVKKVGKALNVSNTTTKKAAAAKKAAPAKAKAEPTAAMTTRRVLRKRA
ncbi:MAG: hypothetical protein MMC23_008863 [Stictis urceolatum]|nr:hypothetical protein [Stictis urceolata]